MTSELQVRVAGGQVSVTWTGPAALPPGTYTSAVPESPMYVWCPYCRRHVKRAQYAGHKAEKHPEVA